MSWCGCCFRCRIYLREGRKESQFEVSGDELTVRMVSNPKDG
jgi:hypothetical protein